MSFIVVFGFVHISTFKIFFIGDTQHIWSVLPFDVASFMQLRM